MPAFLIGYDLHEGENYAALEGTIRRIATTCWHQLDSTWFIVHPGGAQAIRDALIPYLTRSTQPATNTTRSGDKWIVMQLQREGAWTGSFGEATRKWLEANVT